MFDLLNPHQGLGYGVVLTGGGDGNVTVIVENNRFDYNRHTVAGSGERGDNGTKPRKWLSRASQLRFQVRTT